MVSFNSYAPEVATVIIPNHRGPTAKGINILPQIKERVSDRARP